MATAPWHRLLVLAALVLVIAVLSSACYLKALIVSIGVSTSGYPNYDEAYEVTLGAGTLLASCGSIVVNCSYTMVDADGVVVNITSTSKLIADFGINLGLFIDPLVLQVPQSVGGVSGTTPRGGIAYPLVITQTTSFKAGPGTTVTAEPGMKFLIVELPASAADSITATDPEDGHEFDFTLQFSNSTLPIPVKSMFTIRVDAPDATYYLPMLPCTTNFAEVPEMSISFASAMTAEDDIQAMIDTYADMACDGQVYDLRTSPGPGDPGTHTLYAPGLAFN
jgi:hypothetical protein